MKIDYPQEAQLPELRSLWQQAFGDEDAFLDLFFSTAFSPDRCRCMSRDGQVLAALYWLDCRCDGHPMAYIYAVATEAHHQGQGFCRMLMDDTHRLLAALGYCGAILVPGNEALSIMYAGMGYKNTTFLREFRCDAAEAPIPLRRIDAARFASKRREMLPPGSVIQEGESLAFLSGLSRFYEGEDLLLCCAEEDGHLFCAEFLGDSQFAPGALATLGFREGTFRAPGSGRNFAMWQRFSDMAAPQYFAFAFD